MAARPRTCIALSVPGSVPEGGSADARSSGPRLDGALARATRPGDARCVIGERGRRLDPKGLGDHLDRLYRAAFALTGSREAADDLVQDTYAGVLARPRFLRRGDDLGYLLQTLRNTFLSTRRTAARRPMTQPLDMTAEPADERSEWRPERAAETHMVYAAIAELSVDFREVLAAVDIAGLSYREAGRALGVREATITTRLFRARQQVARRLRQSEAATPRKRGAGTPACSAA